MSDTGSLLGPPKGRLLKSDIAALDTLIQQYDQALQSNSEKIASCEKSKGDYLQLWKKLTTLPNSLEYDAMLPLGTRAFCPGKIVHTNEIICHLGDTWYVETSAKTAARIVTNRLKKCEEMLTSLVKEEELYRSWREEANRQKAEAMHEGTIEIQEEYDDEKEKDWRLKHRENLRKHHQNLAKERKQKSEESSKENDIWNRLDELELEEELQEAGISLDSLTIDDSDEKSEATMDEVFEPVSEKVSKKAAAAIPVAEQDNKKVNTPDVNSNECPPVKKSKRVSFSSENVVHTLTEESPLKPYIHPNRRKTMNMASNSSNESKSTSPAVPSSPDPLIIHFKHNKADAPINVESNPEGCNNHSQVVRSPGDILKFFGTKGAGSNCQSPTGLPKSILKAHRQSWPNNTYVPPADDNMAYNPVLTNHSSITSTSKNPVPSNKSKRATIEKVKHTEREPEESVRDTVIERGSGVPPNRTYESSNDQDANKPVSLFKQSRQKK